MKAMAPIRFSSITKADVNPNRPLYCKQDLLLGGFCRQLGGFCGDVFVPKECISSLKPSSGDETKDDEVMYLTHGNWYREDGTLRTNDGSAFLVFNNGVCRDFSLRDGNWHPNKLKNIFIRMGYLIGKLFSSSEEESFSPWGV